MEDGSNTQPIWGTDRESLQSWLRFIAHEYGPEEAQGSWELVAHKYPLLKWDGEMIVDAEGVGNAPAD